MEPGCHGTPQKKSKDKQRYQYGNHSRYYGYQGFYGDQKEGRVGLEDDPRLRLLEADWFRDRKVLDVGCGAGHLTLAVARRFNPAHILGVELDKRLVHAANQNIRHFMSHDLAAEKGRGRELLPSATCAQQAEPSDGLSQVSLKDTPTTLQTRPLHYRDTHYTTDTPIALQTRPLHHRHAQTFLLSCL